GKYSTYEGGTRVPFLVRWPKRIKPGTSDALVCQIDLLASLAALVGQAVPGDAALDSENVLAALLGESRTGRELLVEHAAGLALRKDQWKYIAPRPPRGAAAKGQATGKPSPGELYNLAEDPGETKNLASERPELVRKLDTTLNEIRVRP
ncbi:MAG: sulfatase-like hydrolase/transferase, partial [Pirellulales bacterium]